MTLLSAPMTPFLNSSLVRNGSARIPDNPPTPAFNHLCEKASKWIQYLPDIEKLENQFYVDMGKSYEDEDNEDEDNEDNEDEDGEDEDEKQKKEQRLKQMQKEKTLLLEKTGIMIKIMADIVEDIGEPRLSKLVLGCPYDIEKGTTCSRNDGSRYYVKKEEHLSEAQLKLSTLAYCLAHPSPEEIKKYPEYQESQRSTCE